MRDARKLVPTLSHLPHQVVAASIGQSQITHEQVEGLLVGQLHRGSHVTSHFDHVPFRGQNHPHHLRSDAVVLDQQDAQGADGSLLFSNGERVVVPSRRGQRQSDAERRALFPAFAMSGDCAAVHLDQRLADRQAQAQTAKLLGNRRSACSKALKIRESASGSIPIPLSLTSIIT